MDKSIPAGVWGQALDKTRALQQTSTLGDRVPLWCQQVPAMCLPVVLSLSCACRSSSCNPLLPPPLPRPQPPLPATRRPSLTSMPPTAHTQSLAPSPALPMCKQRQLSCQLSCQPFGTAGVCGHTGKLCVGSQAGRKWMQLCVCRTVARFYQPPVQGTEGASDAWWLLCAVTCTVACTCTVAA